MVQCDKLVRDNIPEIIRSEGGQPMTETLSEERYIEELEKSYKKKWRSI